MNSINTIGSLLFLLSVGNLAMFARMFINTRRLAKLFSIIYSLSATSLAVAFTGDLNIQNVGTLLLAICALILPLNCYCFFHRRSLRSSVANSPHLSQWILRHFTVLDIDGDGTIGSGDLFAFCQKAKTDTDDLRMAKEIQCDLCIIGHVTKVSISGSPFGVTVINHYGISAVDAASYPDRIARAQALEFGNNATNQN